jgi:hypothetical protein
MKMKSGYTVLRKLPIVMLKGDNIAGFLDMENNQTSFISSIL